MVVYAYFIQKYATVQAKKGRCGLCGEITTTRDLMAWTVLVEGIPIRVCSICYRWNHTIKVGHGNI